MCTGLKDDHSATATAEKGASVASPLSGGGAYSVRLDELSFRVPLATVQIKHILTVLIRILTVFSPLQPGRLQLFLFFLKHVRMENPASVCNESLTDSALSGGGAYSGRMTEQSLTVQRSCRLERGSTPESVAIRGRRRIVWSMQTADGGNAVCLFGIRCKEEEEE